MFSMLSFPSERRGAPRASVTPGVNGSHGSAGPGGLKAPAPTPERAGKGRDPEASPEANGDDWICWPLDPGYSRDWLHFGPRSAVARVGLRKSCAVRGAVSGDSAVGSWRDPWNEPNPFVMTIVCFSFPSRECERSGASRRGSRTLD